MKMNWTRTLTSLIAATMLLAGCDNPSGTQELQTSRSALSPLESETISKHKLPGEQLLAVGQRGGLIFGTPDDALAHTDQPLLFTPRFVDKSGKTALLPDDLGKIASAYFLPGEDDVLFLTEDHRLTQWNGEALEVLAKGVQGPIAISPSGRFLTYLEGEEPIYSVVLRERETNKVSSPGQQLQGCWSPAVGDDGSVAFMSSASGYGELYLAKRGEAPVKLTTREQGQTIAVPSGPSAPLLVDGNLYFEDQRGLHRIDLSRRGALESVLLSPGARDLVWSVGGTQAWGQRDGNLTVSELKASGGTR